MKSIKAVLYGKPIRCPACGTELRLGATVRLQTNREIGQDAITDYPPKETAKGDSDG